MIRYTALFILAIILASSCTERIEVQLDTTYTRLVVDGNIETDTGIYQVRLTKSADYFANVPAGRVVNATVTLTDGENTFPLHETEPGISGIYETDAGFAGVAGETYTLQIDMEQEISGNQSARATCFLPHVTTLDSISTEFYADWGKEGFWAIKLWAREPGDEVNYYLFNFYRNGILMTDTITEKVVSDDQFYNGSYMKGVDVVYVNNEDTWQTFRPGDTIVLQMSGITKEYYDFINQVDMAGFNIPFFSGPPANVEGNISNGGIGFFAAFSNSYAMTVVK